MNLTQAPKWPSRQALAQTIETILRSHRSTLPGIASQPARICLVQQMIASLRRQDYTKRLLSRPIDAITADPKSGRFDPERAAIFHMRQGHFDEAVWLVFLTIHFGKHAIHNWRMLTDVYSGLGTQTWTWDRVRRDPALFRTWLIANSHNVKGGFGNHRKYESIEGGTARGTGAVIESFVSWVGPSGSCHKKFSQMITQAGNDPNTIFDFFYRNFSVIKFGRLGKFDFLCMLGRIGLAPIAPGIAYLAGATGPLRGARLLFTGDAESRMPVAELEKRLAALDSHLKIGKQALEDSLCNWQKSPNLYVHYR